MGSIFFVTIPTAATRSVAHTAFADGSLGEWPDFVPIDHITAPHPDYPEYQTHLWEDWSSIVGEEFIFL